MQPLTRMRPSSFWRQWLITLFALVMIALPGLDLLLFGRQERQLAQWTNGLWGRKLHAAKSAPAGAGRLLVIGGSSVAFSVDAELLEARLRMPVYNMGTHGALGLRFLLDDAREAARTGDTVLLHLEYAQYRRDPDELSDVEQEVIWSGRVSRLFRFPFPVIVSQIYEQPFSAYQAGWAERDGRMAVDPNSDGNLQVYGIDEMGPRGDYRSSVGPATPKPLDLASVGPVKKVPAALLRDFFRWCRRRHINVIATRPGVIRSADADLQEQKRAYEAIAPFYNNAHIPLLNTEQIFQLPKEFFYDTTYHANAAGRRIITETLARELARVIGKQRESGGPVLLVASPGSLPGDLVLSDKPISQSLLLSATDLNHPLTVTPDGVRKLCAAGETVVTADPAVHQVLAEAGMQLLPVAQRTALLRDWVASSHDQVFAIAKTGTFDSRPLAEGLPPRFSSALSGDGWQAEIIGTGRYQAAKGIRDSSGSAGSNTPLTVKFSPAAAERSGWKFPTGLALYSGPAPKHPAIQLLHTGSRRPILPNAANGLAVVVFNPGNGRVTESGVFQGPELTQWQLEQVKATTPE